jgi:hypothetical protein
VGDLILTAPKACKTARRITDLQHLALPGGPMFVSLGVIPAAANEAQLAGVMGHEMSHYTCSTPRSRPVRSKPRVCSGNYVMRTRSIQRDYSGNSLKVDAGWKQTNTFCLSSGWMMNARSELFLEAPAGVLSPTYIVAAADEFPHRKCGCQSVGFHNLFVASPFRLCTASAPGG